MLTISTPVEVANELPPVLLQLTRQLPPEPAVGGGRVTAALLAANRRTFASLRKHRNYRLFFVGQVISTSGTWMQNIATAWLVLAISGSPVAVGVLAVFQF